MQKALLLINPGSRRGVEARSEVIARLAARGLQCETPQVSDAGDFAGQIAKHRGEVDWVILGGGDGTVRSALHALVEHKMPLGVVPLGTANNLARNLEIPLDLEEACEVLVRRKVREIDVASVNDARFLNVAGLGLSTEINRALPAALKKRWGILAYVIGGLKVLHRIRPFRAEIDCDGEVVRVRAIQITVCNGRHYGAGLIIREDASINDARLDLCSTESANVWQTLALLPALKTGRHAGSDYLRIMRGKRIRVRTRHSRVIDTDGELTTRTPAVFELAAGALKVVTGGGGE